VSPSPQVGCVLVLAGEVLGARANQHDALDHAEIAALKSAHEAGCDPRGATAYLTLEPCSNYGRTGSCADALIAAGIARCVVATINPNPAWPPFRAQLCALLMSWYNTSLREGNTSEKFAAGRNDLFMSVYLPFCDVFVTRDADQESCLRELTKYVGVDTEIPRWMPSLTSCKRPDRILARPTTT
jgi:hypothetical protein